jgi:hypothetical protein
LPLNEPLESFIPVLQEMPAIGNLLRLRRALSSAISVLAGAPENCWRTANRRMPGNAH